MSVLTTKQLGSNVGAEVLDVDRDRLLHDEELPAATLEALDANGALVFRDLHVDDATQVAFSRKLGKVEVLGKGELPEIFRVTLDPAKNPVAAYLRGTFDWHLDGATDDIPIMATVLSAHAVAASGGETEFSSTYAAYDDLSDADKERYQKVRVVHSFEAAQRLTTPNPSPEELAMWRKRPSKTHPLVWRHQSGRRSLVLGATDLARRGNGRRRRTRLARRAAGVVHHTGAGVPARVVGRRHGHLGQPRRAAPSASLRRSIGARHAPHDHRR